MKIFIGILLIIPILIWSTGRIYNGIRYDIDCGGHLKRAADANTVNIAAKELDVVLEYLEEKQMTTGYTSVLWQTPDEDVSFWFNNIKSAREELRMVSEQTSQLERTNILMKLRETLLDDGKNGQHVTEPDGISIFPSNPSWFVFGWMSGIGFIVVAEKKRLFPFSRRTIHEHPRAMPSRNTQDRL